MSKALVIDGKKYLPSSVLSGRFSYTTDYLSKLAREQKVLAKRQGRVWFIEEASLQQFVAAAAAAKAERSESLRQQRRAERDQAEIKTSSVSAAEKKVERGSRSVSVSSAVALPSAWESLVQAVAVTVCGVLVGTLGFVAQSNGVTISQLVDSTETLVLDVQTGLVPDALPGLSGTSQSAWLDFSAIMTWLFGGQEVIVEDVPRVVPTAPGSVKVTQNAMLMLDPTTSTSSVKAIQESFSDEVDVTFDGPNTGILQPVFKEKTDESYRFVLVPVTEAKEN